MGGGKPLCLCRSHGRKAGISPVRIKSVQNCSFLQGPSLLHTPGSAKWARFFHGVVQMISAQFTPKTAFDCNPWLDFSHMWLSCCFWQRSQNLEHVCAWLTANGSCQAAATPCVLCTALKQSWAGKVTSDQTRQPEGGKERKQHTEAERLSAPEQYWQHKIKAAASSSQSLPWK